jgi:hypothetical protein
LTVCLAFTSASSTSAAPLMGVGVSEFDRPITEPVHCRRWLPHRHSGAKPHGFGSGCGLKKPRPARPRVRGERPTAT